jgi:tetratricopeptide (TPR) repeat protein
MMMHKLARFSRCRHRAPFAALLIALPLLSAHYLAAQPGDRRSPQEIRKDLESKLAEVETLLAEEPDRHYLYQSRGQALTELYRHSSDQTERESLAERAFADFDTYQLLTKDVPLLPRAELHQLMWFNEFPDPRRTDPAAPTLESVRSNPHFEGAVAAFLERIHQLKASFGYGARDERLRDLYARVSNLYLMRAQVFAKTPEAMRTMDERHLAWDDFDRAAKYREKSVYAPTLLHATEVYIDKAEAAFNLGEYDLALESYQAADDYMEPNWKEYCEYHGADNCEYWRRGYVDRVNLLRARTYMKVANYEKVILNLDEYLSHRPPLASRCPQQLLMRAEANRKLGNVALALADEKKARTAGGGPGCN